MTPPPETAEARIARESEYWNEQARRTESHAGQAELRVAITDRHDHAMPWLPYLGVPVLVERLLAELQPLAGRRVLDLGCGTGFLSTLLALHGAEVHAVDVSDGALRIAAERARLSGVGDKVHVCCIPGERLDAFEDGFFDAAAGSFVLHHADLDDALPELKRVLKPGAPAAFIETWGRNRPLMLARALVPGRAGVEKSSSDDEAPLGRAQERSIEAHFPGARFEFPELLCVRMLGVLPFLKGPGAHRSLAALDRWLGAIPGLRQYTYFALVALRRGG
ncbi:MAG: class I SAM-dependent methyltransferase [Rhizobacter sp.]|nr:class I SAM-dependent methyltransferase [Rhizobacter sp.]